MRNIDKIVRDIRPSLRIVAPMTYYISWGFAIFNLFVSIPLLSIRETSFLIVGAISLEVWALTFLVTGLLFTYSLVTNNWKMTRFLMLEGVCIKTAWLMELIARAASGRSLILVAIWALLVYLQVITYIYFTPLEQRHGR